MTTTAQARLRRGAALRHQILAAMEEELAAAQGSDDPWPHLERAHILSQPWAWPHTKVHAAMLRVAVRQRNRRETLGQLVRLLVAGPGSLVGKAPTGNTGRSTMGLTETAAVPPDLAAVLAGRGPAASSTVKQLRLVVEANDFDGAVSFYRDAVGMPEEFYVESEGGARVMALQAGRATLELVNPAQRQLIDRLEVGREASREIRVAFEVSDTTATTGQLVDAGAELLAPPTETPWRSLNARFEAPAGLQITLFEELDAQG